MRNASLFDLSGRKALVTGASRGIGRSIAEALSAAGADIAVTARTLTSLEETTAAIRAAGSVAHAIALDVTNVDRCGTATAEAARLLGGLDILINNAGMEEVRPSLEVDEALWDRIVDTNLKGAFFCAQAAARQMRSAGRSGGVIVNLCSLTSEIGIPTAVPYGSSKSGLLGMTRALAVEWAELGIRVNAIVPGYVRTAMTDVFFSNQAWQQSMLAKIPQRRFGDLSDLHGVAVFLVSDAAAYITGQSIPVDGGFLASP
jgi:NAD(P)-dependent dehydrogenase (short-subunit alcohol dehydrogenase family)